MCSLKENDMAKVIEDVVIIKVSRIVKDGDPRKTVLDDETKSMLSNTIPQLLDEVIGDSGVIVELAELE